MHYIFEILGVSPILHFFHHQQETLQKKAESNIQYLGTYQCTLDALIESVEALPAKQDWQLDHAIDTVIAFWLNNSDRVQHWKYRLADAGRESVLVSRLADLHSLQVEFEGLFNDHSAGS
ncbi:MAG: hypothetical protein KME16_09895 [Scytolyngbya sp. HA4215-MV1]|jgi:plasmid maintenance system antidote protein VapI|nr:hypothetical protein [Scytolyngbya sp. HA4215-MV1]